MTAAGRVGKVEVKDVKIDPIVVDIPGMVAKFVRFESSADGQRFFVVYEIVAKEVGT